MFLHRCLGATLCAAAMGSLCLAQTAVKFGSKSSLDAQTPTNLHSLDLNGDGFDDIVGDTGLSAPGFNVSINNGDGTFKAPVHYTLPAASSNAIGSQPMVTGDFNNDSKADVVVVIPNTSRIAFFAGNGTGTLAAAKYSTIALPSGWIFGGGGAAAGDFNGDGKEDLVVWTTNSTNPSTATATALYILQGDGTGGFSNPHKILSGPRDMLDFQVFTGDFDADGKTDVISTDYELDNNGNPINAHVHVLYGNDDFTFTPTVAYSQASGIPLIGTSDLNSDSYSDFYALNGYTTPQKLDVFYGQAGRTFRSYFNSMSSSYPAGASGDTSLRYNPQLIMGDFNGDNRMDLVVLGYQQSTGKHYVEFWLATGNEGQFTLQLVPMAVTYPEDSLPIVGLFSNSKLKPDLAFNHSQNYGSPPGDRPSYLVAEINQATSGWFGPCHYPNSAEGFDVCAAGAAQNGKSLFSASANSFGEMRKIALWVDGKKVAEQYNAWDHHAYFQWAGSFSNGTHQASFIAADVDNRLQRHKFTFTVGSSSCSAPASDGVHVCSPANNSTVSSPVWATATAKISGTLARMEIWVDGAKKYSQSTSLSENTSIALPKGKHQFKFNAINTAGAKWVTTVYATVQ